jgi:glycosyltransferase involved in cell wall biosynthesis
MRKKRIFAKPVEEVFHEMTAQTGRKGSSQPLVSVVTACYNEERHLAQCIESVLSQSYGNFEYIIVNNCSTDRSLEIARTYAEKDSRIRVLDNEVFLSSDGNCNHGLRQISADSRYCKMVFGDDWIFPECLERMVTVAEAHPSVGIVGAYRLDDRKVNCDGLPYPSVVTSGREICRKHLLDGLFLFGSSTTLLFRSDIVHSRNPFYTETSVHADTEACYEILRDHDFGFVHQVLTFTRRDNGSLTGMAQRYRPNILDDLIVLKKYGRYYLDETEYSACLDRSHARYYDFLSESILSRKPADFWEYHANGLRTIGESIERPRLARHFLCHLAEITLNPLATAGKILRRFEM